MLTDKAIKKIAATTATYDRGCHYYQYKHVKKLHYSPQDRTFEAQVSGSTLYIIVVELNKDLAVEHYHCDCPAFYETRGACKHITAVLLAIKDHWHSFFPDQAGTQQALSAPTQELLTFFRKGITDIASPPGTTDVQLLPTLFLSTTEYQRRVWLEFTIGTDRMYVLKDIPQLLAALDRGHKIAYGQKFTLVPQDAVFEPTTAELLEQLRQAYAEERQRASWGYYNSVPAFSEQRRFRLTDSSLQRFLSIMGQKPVALVVNHQEMGSVPIKTGRPPLELTAKPAGDGLRLTMNLADQSLYALDTDLTYLYCNDTIYHVDPLFSQYLRPLLKCFASNKKPEIDLPAVAVSDFVSAMLPALQQVMPVHFQSAAYNRFYQQPLERIVYLDRMDDGISAKVEFRYGETSVNPITATSSGNITPDGKWLLRDIVGEAELLALLKKYGFTPAQDKLVQPDEQSAFDFLQDALPELQKLADIYYADDFAAKIRPPSRISAGVRLNQDNDLLEFTLASTASPQELLELLASYKQNKQYHRLKDGSFVTLNTPEFQSAAQLIEQLGLRAADLEKQVIELPKYRALYLDSLARETDALPLQRNSAFKKMVQDIREPQDVEYAIPPGICAQLRDYQKTGFKWLKSLTCYGLGGILADDMGLGKTLQILTFLVSEKTTPSRPSLVVAPTSLIYNWQEEAAKFTPELNVLVVSGLQSNRIAQLAEMDHADVIVTSYGSLKRDIAAYETKQFQYCIIDEAQHVKNPHTLNAQSVKRIKAASYFALTGTPIENSLTELWSIFDFLMPGYLGNHKSFTSKYETPIVKNGDQSALNDLSRQIKPFILRRMKKTVLTELPAKIESKLTAVMTAEQTKLYQAFLLKAKAEFESEIAAKGFEHSQIKILALLTRLRQICCHPSLFVSDYNGGSAKLDMLSELLADALSGGHRMLLFSQFTGMLDLIKEQLTAQNTSYHYLDGATKAEDRLKLVHAFNNGDKDLFLISLKAGGTGLNLTGADVVIHYDPWWNPAVEDQATDRAYRIGQRNAVQVYKLLTKGTIEEKIYVLQQKKKEMIDSLIQPGENFLTKMSENEIRDLFSL